MKKPSLLGLSALTLSSLMVMETPVYAATHTYVPSALVSDAIAKSASATDTSQTLTSRTAYGVIYNDRYAESTNELLKKYNKENEDLYMSQGLTDSFDYFNADNYLQEYTDVKEGLTEQLSEEKKDDADALKEAALDHYVHYGMLEGRDCGTAFNPVIALLAYPELYKDVSDLSPDNVRKIFQDNIHVEDTTEFSIYFYNVDDTEMLSIVRNKKDSSAKKYTMSDVLADAGISTDSASTSSSDSGKKESSDSDKKDTSDSGVGDTGYGKGSVSGTDVPEKINNKSADIAPYNLYSSTGDSTELSIAGKATTNYQLIKDQLTNKYTMMLYLCGSNNLEEPGNYSLSNSIISIMKAAPKNMNIVLLIGGTASYSSTYLTNEIGKDKTGIFYLDTSKLPEDVDLDNCEYDEVLNENTLVEISTFDTANIGDSALLSGFMNLSTELFPAQDYGLILWNHGGGVIGGICDPDDTYLKGTDNLSTDDLESALRSSNIVKTGSKLGMLAFDACLMGCSEIAYNLHNYYNYMYASEEIESGDFDYYKMFSEMDAQLGDGTATDYSLIKAIHDNFSYMEGNTSSHTGDPYLQQTGSVYDAAATEKYITALNDMGKQLNNLIDVAPSGDEILLTLAIARAKCETLYIDGDYEWSLYDPKYADIGELTYYLKEDLTTLKKEAEDGSSSEDYINAIQAAIDSISAVQKTGCLVMTSTWYDKNMIRSYAGEQATSIEDMQTIAPVSDFWRKAQGSAASYGTSVYFPYVFNGGKGDNTLTTYSDFYNNTALSDYSALITRMINWKMSDAYQKQVKALTTELTGINLFDSASIEDYGDTTSPKYLVIKFKEQYDEGKAPENTFNSPMYDALTTMSGNITIYASNAMADAKGKTIPNYSKVAMKVTVGGENFNFADSSINTQLSLMSGYGIFQKGVVADDELDFKVLADAESNKDDKNAILTAVNNAYTNADADKYKIVYGSVTLVDTVYDYVYHVFEQSENNEYTYVYYGTALYNDDSYSAATEIECVSFYDYYLHNTEDNSTEYISYTEEERPNYIPAAKTYTVGDGVDPILLKKFTFSGEGATSKAEDFSYTAALQFTTGTDEDGNPIIKNNYSGYFNFDSTEKTDETTDSDSDASTDENTDSNSDASSDENTGSDSDASADENTGSDSDASADENTGSDSEQGSDAETPESTDDEA